MHPRLSQALWALAPVSMNPLQVRVHPTGSVTLYTGTHSHGQGHETTFAQLVSESFGHPRGPD